MYLEPLVQVATFVRSEPVLGWRRSDYDRSRLTPLAATKSVSLNEAGFGPMKPDKAVAEPRTLIDPV